jgi:hypothetical protein
MISQSSWLYTKSGITAVENSSKIEVESAHLWRAPLYINFCAFEKKSAPLGCNSSGEGVVSEKLCDIFIY